MCKRLWAMLNTFIMHRIPWRFRLLYITDSLPILQLQPHLRDITYLYARGVLKKSFFYVKCTKKCFFSKIAKGNDEIITYE